MSIQSENERFGAFLSHPTAELARLDRATQTQWVETWQPYLDDAAQRITAAVADRFVSLCRADASGQPLAGYVPLYDFLSRSTSSYEELSNWISHTLNSVMTEQCAPARGEQPAGPANEDMQCLRALLPLFRYHDRDVDGQSMVKYDSVEEYFNLGFVGSEFALYLELMPRLMVRDRPQADLDATAQVALHSPHFLLLFGRRGAFADLAERRLKSGFFVTKSQYDESHFAVRAGANGEDVVRLTVSPQDLGIEGAGKGARPRVICPAAAGVDPAIARMWPALVDVARHEPSLWQRTAAFERAQLRTFDLLRHEGAPADVSPSRQSDPLTL